MQISSNIPEITRQLSELKDKLPTVFQQSLKICSAQMLSWAKQDFEKKTKGESVNGISWNSISREGARSRLRKLGSYRKASKSEKSQMIDQTVSQHSIGVDTGRLRNSLSIGNSENINVVTTSYAVIGTKISYADYFNRLRAIFGADFINSERQKKLESIINNSIDDAIGKEQL
jgi:hypothetical protein